MTAPDPAWVKAGAAALANEGVSDRSTGGLSEEGMAWVVVRAVAPLIRADVIREVALDTAAGIVDPGLRAALTDEIREQIAAQIEAQPIDAWGSQAPRGPVTFARREAVLRSARIARGEAQ